MKTITIDKVRHVNKKSLKRMVGRIGYYLQETEDGYRGVPGDYTDGQARYHLVEGRPAKCVLSDCTMKF